MLTRPLSSLLILTTCLSCVGAQDPAAGPSQRLQVLREAGVSAPLTLYPVQVLGRHDTNVAEVLGLTLERLGMSDLQIAPKAFDPGQAAWDAVPALFQAHARQAAAPGVPARYSLYAQFLGDPRQGPTEVRFVVVDATGERVLFDRQTPADAAFQRTAGRDPDPLGCAALVGERLFASTGWRKVAGGVKDGPFAERWRQKSGAPDANERQAISKRLQTLRANLADATITVLPTAWSGPADAAGAQRLAAAVKTGLACKTTTAVATKLEVPASSNQQKRLWDLASSLRASLARQPIDTDYALVADIGLDGEGKHGLVNMVLVTKAGEVVVADFQNDQHPLFQQLAPKTLADGERLAVERLRSLLR